jgi:large subunit ribosomal protein L29
MAKEKLSLTDKTAEALAADLAGLERELHSMKFDHAVKGLPNPMVLRDTRRDIARIQTELRSREVALMTPEQLANRSKLRDRRRRQR